MTDPTFLQLNHGWNAEPNAPAPQVEVNGSEVTLRFLLNPFQFEAAQKERGLLTFGGCSEWRMGNTNDEGWYLGQCRYSGLAPAWGEFYEVVGPDSLAHEPRDWNTTDRIGPGR